PAAARGRDRRVIRAAEAVALAGRLQAAAILAAAATQVAARRVAATRAAVVASRAVPAEAFRVRPARPVPRAAVALRRLPPGLISRAKMGAWTRRLPHSFWTSPATSWSR